MYVCMALLPLSSQNLKMLRSLCNPGFGCRFIVLSGCVFCALKYYMPG